MGQDPSDEEIFEMIAAVDEDGSNEIGAFAAAGRTACVWLTQRRAPKRADFPEFCKVIKMRKANESNDGESDTCTP